MDVMTHAASMWTVHLSDLAEPLTQPLRGDCETGTKVSGLAEMGDKAQGGMI